MKIITSAEFHNPNAFASWNYEDCYVSDICVKVRKFGGFDWYNRLVITDLTNAAKVGKTCTEWTIGQDCSGFNSCDNYKDIWGLLRSVCGSDNLAEAVEILRRGDYAETVEDEKITVYTREKKGVDTFSPFAVVKPVKVPSKWTMSHVWKSIYSGQIVSAHRDYRYTDDYAYDNANNFGECDMSVDALAGLAEKIIESGYSGWWVSCNKTDENGNYIIDLGLHSFEAWTLVFSPSANITLLEQLTAPKETPEAEEPTEEKAVEVSESSEERPIITMSSFDPDNDPEPTDPTPTPDDDAIYSDFDNYFKALTIVSVSFGGAQNSAETPKEGKKMPKRKKLTEKEWKRQLEEKAAFEVSERAAKREFIYNKLRNAQIGDLIAETSLPEYPETIVEIDREDCNGEPEYFVFRTNYGNSYEGFDFLDDDRTGEPASVFFPSETEQEQEQDENQITFDDIAVAYSTNETAENMPEAAPVSTSAANSALIGFKVGTKSNFKIFRTATDARATPKRSKTARRRGGVGRLLLNGSKKLLGAWRGAVRSCPCIAFIAL